MATGREREAHVMTLTALSCPATVPVYTVPAVPEASTSPSTTLHTTPLSCNRLAMPWPHRLSPGPVVARHMLLCTHLPTLLQHLLSHFTHQLVAQLIQGPCRVVCGEAESAPVLWARHAQIIRRSCAAAGCGLRLRACGHCSGGIRRECVAHPGVQQHDVHLDWNFYHTPQDHGGKSEGFPH